MMYIDVDAFVISSHLNVTSIIELLSMGQFHLAAVMSPRPVLERVAATQIRNPFYYFNSGVMFGVKDKRFDFASIADACATILKFDSLNIY